MQLGLFLYRVLNWLISPFLGMVMRNRVSKGKERAERLNERFATDLTARPSGTLIWFHAASVGENLIQLELLKRLISTKSANFSALMTCQTATAAQQISTALLSLPHAKTRVIQQMAPLDTSTISKRFFDHWKPDAIIYAEGEIWPNQLLESDRRNIPSALINARMTQKSIRGWSRWPRTANRLFGVFSTILTSDTQTQSGLESILNRALPCPGNLKSSLPPPDIDSSELQNWVSLLAGRKILLAASTHAPEESALIDTWETMPQAPFLILAPRHPERGDEVANILDGKGIQFTRLTETRELVGDSKVLLADTLGEMGLWYRLADTVYLGGAHAPHVGGHNPLEALQLGKPVLTGPDHYNFKDMARTLCEYDGYTIIKDISDISNHFPADAPSTEMLDYLAQTSEAPMQETLVALAPLLEKAGIR